MSAILHMVEYDFRNFFRYKWRLVGLISMNLADLFIMALVYNQMLSPAVTKDIGSYFNFFAPGLAVTGLFASASASFVVEDFGTKNIVEREKVMNRFEELSKMI